MSVLNPVARVGSQFLDAVGTSTAFRSRESSTAASPAISRSWTSRSTSSSAYPHQLSGGMRQRVIVALATFLHPQVILADEPTTALDVVVQRGIITMLAELQRREQNTLVIVSHDMGVHYQLAGRMAIMYAGKLVELADLDAIVDSPLHPYTSLLIGALPRIGDHARRQGIGGSPPSLLNPPPGCRFAPRCPRAMAVCRTRRAAAAGAPARAPRRLPPLRRAERRREHDRRRCSRSTACPGRSPSGASSAARGSRPSTTSRCPWRALAPPS